MLEEFENTGIFPNIFAKGFEVHKEVNERTTKGGSLEPLDILVDREWPFFPVLVGETECNIVGKTIVLHEKLNVFAAFWAIDEVWTAPFKNLIPAFCENAPKAKLIGPFCELVVIGKLGVAIDFATYAKELVDTILMLLDLSLELFAVIEEGE